MRLERPLEITPDAPVGFYFGFRMAALKSAQAKNSDTGLHFIFRE